MLWINKKEGMQNLMASYGEESKDSHEFQIVQEDEVFYWPTVCLLNWQERGH